MLHLNSISSQISLMWGFSLEGIFRLSVLKAQGIPDGSNPFRYFNGPLALFLNWSFSWGSHTKSSFPLSTSWLFEVLLLPPVQLLIAHRFACCHGLSTLAQVWGCGATDQFSLTFLLGIVCEFWFFYSSCSFSFYGDAGRFISLGHHCYLPRIQTLYFWICLDK